MPTLLPNGTRKKELPHSCNLPEPRRSKYAIFEVLVSDGPSTPYLRFLVSKAIPLLVFETRVLKH